MAELGRRSGVGGLHPPLWIGLSALFDAGGRRQEFVLFLFSYVILVVWIFFQVSVAVLLENFLAARCSLLRPRIAAGIRVI